ncbi:MAG: outer membrane beta-barrel protein [Syntrophales bacterium]|nr:outer membrane beta-barrel protein [Syntrophales bacterium]
MKTRAKVFLPVVLAAVLALSGAAHAQPYRSASPFYVGIFGAADLALDESGMVGMKFGYILPQARALAIELEWNYMFEQDIPPQVIGGVRESGDVALSNVLVNLILRYPEGKIHPYIGAGIGASSMNIRNTESVGGTVYVAEETETGFAWQFLAGVNVELAPNLSADLAYRYFGTNPDFTVIDVDYRAHAVTFGLNFHF